MEPEPQLSAAEVNNEKKVVDLTESDGSEVSNSAPKRGRGRRPKQLTEEQRKAQEIVEKELRKQKLVRLEFLLNKTQAYSEFLQSKLIENQQQEKLKQEEQKKKQLKKQVKEEEKAKNDNVSEKRSSQRISDAKAERTKNEDALTQEAESDRKRKRNESDTSVSESPAKKAKRTPRKRRKPNVITESDIAVDEELAAEPKGVIRDYQKKGVEWRISLYENGLNGILADEMGLGKTIQCISFLEYLRTHGVQGPFLIVAPLSTVQNWMNEFEKWAPAMKVLLFYALKNTPERSTIKAPTIKYHAYVTSYDFLMIEQRYLRSIQWKYLIIDEGQRIKNLNCKLVKTLKSFHSSNRLLLSGTPLQNNLSELWSLLNFLLPDLFNDLDAFQSWFDFSEKIDQKSEVVTREEEERIVSKLHSILQPFLLRRLKSDVELGLPEKKEKILYTSLTPIQRQYYTALLDRQLDKVLKAAGANVQSLTTAENLLMQLRKICDHPYLFDWPVDEEGYAVVDENIIKLSGKMQLLDRLLPILKKRGDKVLIFSQFTTMLDVVEDFAHLRRHEYRRLDGSTTLAERQEYMQDFNTDPDIFMFLLSTRAGGLGINLVAANTVIFVDSDWNPQIDLQAQDRCHRIGQTRPVSVFRLATANSVETRLLARANKKRKLEHVVIHKNKFKGSRDPDKGLSPEELQELLDHSDFATIGTAIDEDDASLLNFDEKKGQNKDEEQQDAPDIAAKERADRAQKRQESESDDDEGEENEE